MQPQQQQQQQQTSNQQAHGLHPARPAPPPPAGAAAAARGPLTTARPVRAPPAPPGDRGEVPSRPAPRAPPCALPAGLQQQMADVAVSPHARSAAAAAGEAGGSGCVAATTGNVGAAPAGSVFGSQHATRGELCAALRLPPLAPGAAAPLRHLAAGNGCLFAGPTAHAASLLLQWQPSAHGTTLPTGAASSCPYEDHDSAAAAALGAGGANSSSSSSKARVSAVLFGPVPGWLWAGGADGRVHCWAAGPDGGCARHLHSWAAHNGKVKALAVSPCGRLFTGALCVRTHRARATLASTCIVQPLVASNPLCSNTPCPPHPPHALAPSCNGHSLVQWQHKDVELRQPCLWRTQQPAAPAAAAEGHRPAVRRGQQPAQQGRRAGGQRWRPRAVVGRQGQRQPVEHTQCVCGGGVAGVAAAQAERACGVAGGALQRRQGTDTPRPVHRPRAHAVLPRTPQTASTSAAWPRTAALAAAPRLPPTAARRGRGRSTARPRALTPPPTRRSCSSSSSWAGRRGALRRRRSRGAAWSRRCWTASLSAPVQRCWRRRRRLMTRRTPRAWRTMPQ
jgi:hypothetical protein